VEELVEHMRVAHEMLREKQWQVQTEDLYSITWGTGSGVPTTAGAVDKRLNYSPSSWGPTW